MNNNASVLFLAAIGPAVFGAAGLVLLKRAAGDLRGLGIQDMVYGLIQVGQSGNFWVGLSLYIAAFLWLIISLPYVKVSQFFPIAVALNITFTTLAAWTILHESIPLVRVAGILLITTGAILVSR
jgi:multidrug transporter EmrE-like cation transporter